MLFRSASIVAVFGTLGAGVLNMRFNSRFDNQRWARVVTGHRAALPAAVAAIVLAAALLYSVLITEGNPLLLQPGFQALIALALAAVVYMLAHRRARKNGQQLTRRLREAPEE